MIIDLNASLATLNDVNEMDNNKRLNILKPAIRLAKKVYKDININNYNSADGYRHLIGRLCLTLLCVEFNVPYIWRYPEINIHPEFQANLTDVIIALADIDAGDDYAISKRR